MNMIFNVLTQIKQKLYETLPSNSTKILPLMEPGLTGSSKNTIFFFFDGATANSLFATLIDL